MRTFRVTWADGEKENIPEICLIGWTQGAELRGEPATVADFLTHWRSQTLMGREYERQVAG